MLMSERVYNFQRLLALRLGFGTREHDEVPYRSLGPVLEEEYESRAERYDQQLENIGGIEVEKRTTTEKLKIIRDIRTTRYNNLRKAVYTRRGWSTHGVPTIEKVKALGIGFNDVLELIAPYQ